MTKPKPSPPAPREVWLLCSERGTIGYVNYESRREAKYAADTIYNDPTLKPVKFVPEEQTK